MPKKKSAVNKIIVLIGTLYYFSRAAITKHHNWVAKKQKFIVWQFWRLEVQNKVLAKLAPSEALRGEFVPGPYSTFWWSVGNH